MNQTDFRGVPFAKPKTPAHVLGTESPTDDAQKLLNGYNERV